jgi:hypothetical protein
MKHSAVFLGIILVACSARAADIVVPGKTYVDSGLMQKANKTDLEQIVSALATFIPNSARGAANGVATLGADGRVPVAQLPVGTVAGTIAAGDDARFDSVPIGAAITPATGRAAIWIEP